MRRGNLFWGVILIMLGGLFFLKTAGVINDVLEWFWPLALVLLGGWVLGSRYMAGDRSLSGDTFSIDLQGATRLNLEIDQGAGAVFVGPGAPAGVAVTGSQGAGLEVKSERSGDSLAVQLNAGPSFIPFLGPEGGEWRFNLTGEVPVSIKLDAGASNLDLDLTDIKLVFLGVDTGASGVIVKLPANAGHSLVDIQSGAASIDLRVPEGVGARINSEHGLSTINIDPHRFPLQSPGLYQSADYDSAPNKIEINLVGGVNTVKVA